MGTQRLNSSTIYRTKMKELKQLFFNEALRQWHFEDLVKEAELSRDRTNYFLRELIKEKLITRVKPRGKMPHYIANRDLPKFRLEKRLFGLQLVEKTGLFEDLTTRDGIKTAILFGSFSRGDWSKSSDVDLFIFGDTSGFVKEKFEQKLKRPIQLFAYTNSKEIKEDLDPTVIPNLIKGFTIKDSIEPFEVRIHG